MKPKNDEKLEPFIVKKCKCVSARVDYGFKPFKSEDSIAIYVESSLVLISPQLTCVILNFPTLNFSTRILDVQVNWSEYCKC